MKAKVKYFLDFDNEGNFYLKEIESRDTVFCGTFKDFGIDDNDPEYTNKLDDIFQSNLNIGPEEWEVG